MSNNKKKRVWIAWEHHRRSIELAKEFNAELYTFDEKGSRFAKYWPMLYKTIQTLIKVRPNVLFVQNPSVLLATLACLLKPFFGYVLVVDRHTNFKFDSRHSRNPKWLIFHALSKFTLVKADISIVTNRHLKLLVNKLGGTAVVLPDKLPDLTGSKLELEHHTPFSALFICTFASDEPYLEMFKAFEGVEDVTLYVTGNFKKALAAEYIENLPNSIKLLGFVPEADYFGYLKSVDFTIIITSQEFTLNCGSYESVSAEKPMILSNTVTIKSYFNKGCCYIDPDKIPSIAGVIQNMTSNYDSLHAEVVQFKEENALSWRELYNSANFVIERRLVQG